MSSNIEFNWDPASADEAASIDDSKQLLRTSPADTQICMHVVMLYSNPAVHSQCIL